MEQPCRIGAVEYLNTVPLVRGLDLADGVVVSYDVPSRLADGLARGAYDVALIPMASYLAGVGETIVTGVSISCRGPVGTIKLFCRRPLGEVRTLGLDRGSRSSAALARAILSARYGIHPDCMETDPDLEALPTDVDAALIIGDAHLLDEGTPAGASLVIDIGQLWWEWQRVPLVLAAWVFREGQASESVARALREARDRGLAEIDAIAQEEGARRGMPADLIRRYLRKMLDTGLGPEHVKGIERYRDLLMGEGLLTSSRELRFLA